MGELERKKTNLKQKLEVGQGILLCLMHRVNAWYSGSILVEITLLISPYKIILNDSNGQGYYFLKCYYHK
jgi:hypothetical protein